MTRRTSGLHRDADIIRRRAWLFLPFLILGIIVAIILYERGGSGTTSASVTMQLQTSIYDLTQNGDRGFTVYDAQALTRRPEFRSEVLSAIGDKNFDYGRYTIILNPNVTTEGVSSGNLVVTISDGNRTRAETYIHDFVTVFQKEFTSPDGIFRKGYVQQQQNVASAAEAQYQAEYQKLQQLAQQAGITAPLALVAAGGDNNTYLQQLATQRAALTTQLAAAQAGVTLPSVGAAGASAPVTNPSFATAQAQADALAAAISSLDKEIGVASGATLTPDLRAQIDTVRSLDTMRRTSQNAVANAESAVTSAFSSADPAYTTSGGHITSKLGLLAVVIGITIVFGLIAIYLVEWLSQLRANSVES